MRAITEIRSGDIAGINVLSLLGADVLFIARKEARYTYFTSYMGNVYYSEQRLLHIEFNGLVKEVKSVAKNVEVIDFNTHPKSDEFVCYVYGKRKEYNCDDAEKYSIEVLIGSSNACYRIERPFSNCVQEGNIEHLKLTMSDEIG